MALTGDRKRQAWTERYCDVAGTAAALIHRSPHSPSQVQPRRHGGRLEEADCCTDRHRSFQNPTEEMVSQEITIAICR